jgi:SAM-dependent methyltransferase
MSKAHLVRTAPKPTSGEIYSVRNLPIFQNSMFESRELARNCTMGDVNLVRDPDSGIFVNRAFRPELMEYDAHYQNEQAVSAVFRSHLDNVAEIIGEHFRGHSLIEVGCGKGHFLEHLQHSGYQITGVDPAYEGTNPSVTRQYFAPELKMRADGIVLRHILEHVKNPITFLNSIRDANGGAGKIYIEVPCFDWICARRAWFDIFYEHVNYFRISDFYRMFGVVHEAGKVFGGQYLYVVADLDSIRRRPGLWIDEFEFPTDFLAGVEHHARNLKSHGRSLAAVWGGASKGVIFTLFMERAGVRIDIVVDTNPAKQGKYLPGTGLKVYSPVEALEILPPRSNVIVMNCNYLAEIRNLTHGRFDYASADHDPVRPSSCILET